MNSGRRQYHNRVSHERWLVSYADFITLMFAFFVVMFASARVDKEKVMQLEQSIQSAFQQMSVSPSKPHAAAPAQAGERKQSDALARTPPQPLGVTDVNHKPEEFAAIQRELEKLLAPEIKRNEVALRLEPDGLIISLREIGFFNSGSAQIKPQAIDAVARVAGFLRDRNCALRIEGHTDNVPIHTLLFASNWELSTARATTLVKFLIETQAFAPERLSAAGYGEFHPVADNSAPAGQQLNRRVDIVVVAEAMSPAQLQAAVKKPASLSAPEPARTSPQ
jgi:chemotaxis protein MotB